MTALLARERSHKEARTLAEEASATWLAAIAEAKTLHAQQHAVYMAEASCDTCAHEEGAYRIMEQIIATYPADRYPQVALKARHQLLLRLDSRQRKDEALEVGNEIMTLFLDNPFGNDHRGHAELCSSTLFVMASLYVEIGHRTEAFALLDGIEARWPGLWTETLVAFKTHR
jgi:Pyruvate/2-oxoacid:ferredoxin oxidoreductase gamma subunit